MAKDYYKLLGVERNASQENIKKAFRQGAMEHHPDRAQDKAAAEVRFKEINEAYAVLSDPEKRRAYDTFGSDRFHQRFSQEDIFRGVNAGSLEDILGGDLFSRFFGGAVGGGGSTRQGPSGGGSPFGAGGPFGAGFHAQGNHRGPPRGQDVEAELTISFDEAVTGGERLISLGQPGGASRSVKVKIPPGSRNDSKLRLKGQGGPPPSGGEPGDLYLVLKVAAHPRFTWRGERDLEVEVAINVVDLILGGTASVPTLRDGDKRIKVKPGTQPGTSIRLKGFGVPESNSRPAGDLYASICVSIPEDLTEQQKQLFEQLRDGGL